MTEVLKIKLPCVALIHLSFICHGSAFGNTGTPVPEISNAANRMCEGVTGR